MTNDDSNPLVVRGRKVRFDENGLACLNDIHRAAGFSKNQRPSDWSPLPGTRKKMERVLELITGKSGNYTAEDMRLVFRTYRGANGGTYADVRLALDYAEYLNPALAIEVKEVFLRYKAADPTLADDIMQRSDAESNEWIAKRSIARAARLGYTATLKEHGVQERGHYAACTNATYQGVFGKNAAQLRKAKGGKKGPLRDQFDLKELATVTFAEVMSTDRIEDEDCQGFVECKSATKKVATAVGAMIESDLKDRQKRIV